MTDDEVREFLATMPAHTGKLATVRKDGAPHVAPVWYALDGESDDLALVFTTGATTAKGHAVRRDPRVALCVDDERPPFAFVIVSGIVTISEDLEQLRHWAGVIGGRYMGADQADAYGERNAVPGELLVRITPTRIVSERDVAGT
jgi:PPOX class probable F420-dependent enzyme